MALFVVAGGSSVSAHTLPKHPATLPTHLLRKIHKNRNKVWHYQDLTGRARTPYHYWAENRCGNRSCRYGVLRIWHRRYHHWRHVYRTVGSTGGVPAWAISFFNCISRYEEYGVDGPNTSAGYFGFVYSPSSYPGGYGSSWLAVPLHDQYIVAYNLYKEYGTSPWTTAYHCA